jgi:L-fuculose-phosphate aldolase
MHGGLVIHPDHEEDFNSVISMREADIRNAVCAAAKKLLRKGYVSGTWGNISQRIDDHLMAITPSGRAYESMRPEDIVLMDYHSHEHTGQFRPSSEYQLHTGIYRAREDIQAVVHTHQLYASVLAAAGREVPPILDDMAQIIGPSLRVTKYLHSNTDAIAQATVQALEGRFAALMANHGAVCIGRSMEEAFVVCEVLEKSCQVYLQAQLLGGANSIDSVYAQEMHMNYLNSYSKLK